MLAPLKIVRTSPQPASRIVLWCYSFAALPRDSGWPHTTSIHAEFSQLGGGPTSRHARSECKQRKWRIMYRTSPAKIECGEGRELRCNAFVTPHGRDSCGQVSSGAVLAQGVLNDLSSTCIASPLMAAGTANHVHHHEAEKLLWEDRPIASYRAEGVSFSSSWLAPLWRSTFPH